MEEAFVTGDCTREDHTSCSGFGVRSGLRCRCSCHDDTLAHLDAS